MLPIEKKRPQPAGPTRDEGDGFRQGLNPIPRAISTTIDALAPIVRPKTR